MRKHKLKSMVSVLDENKNPLMSCSEKRARKLMERGEAKPYWYRGLFCIILQREPSNRETQEICIGIDPGSRFEGFSVKSEAHTLLNIQTEAKKDVKDKVETKATLRRNRRYRKTRYRPCRFNRSRSKGYVPPSTKARWDWKISIVNTLRNLYPITHIGLEDISARTIKGARKWNVNFSPIEVGKNYFRKWVEEQGLELYEFKGFDTYQMRDKYNLKKNSSKSKKDFYTHCVDSWCIANEVVGGHIEVDNTKTIYVKPLIKYRRQLHVQNFAKGGLRKPYGSTRSLGFERGSIVKHPKWGVCLIGGTLKGRISLNRLSDNKRLCQNAKPQDIEILSNNKWNIEN